MLNRNRLAFLFYWLTLFLIIYEIKARSSHILGKCSVSKLDFQFSFYFKIGSHYISQAGHQFLILLLSGSKGL